MNKSIALPVTMNLRIIIIIISSAYRCGPKQNPMTVTLTGTWLTADVKTAKKW